MLLNVARTGGLTAGIVFVSFLGSAADEPATRTSFLTDYQKAFPELEARYSVVQGKGHVLRESHDPGRPQALTTTTFEFARNRDRFKVVSNVRETKNEQGFENDLTRVICYDPKNCFSLIKTRIDDKFRVLTEAESDQKHRFARIAVFLPSCFRTWRESETFFNLPNFAKNKTFKLVEDQDVLINGKTRRRIQFAYDPGDQDRIPKKAGVSHLLSISFLRARLTIRPVWFRQGLRKERQSASTLRNSFDRLPRRRRGFPDSQDRTISNGAR